MTIPKFNPRFTNENHWACASTDKDSPWCLAISDCLWHYENRFWDIPCYVLYCHWPLTKAQFNQDWGAEEREGFDNYEDYIANAKVTYEYSEDCCYYGLVGTDDTLTFAFQNDTYIFVVHIDDAWFPHSYAAGFGCVINKLTNEIHWVELGEDDGNYWANNEFAADKLRDYDIAIVSSVVNDFPEEQLYNKAKLLYNLFRLAKVK